LTPPHVEAPKAEAPVAMSVAPSAQRAEKGRWGNATMGAVVFALGRVGMFLSSRTDWGRSSTVFRNVPVIGMV
jgi:hypothetical protein